MKKFLLAEKIGMTQLIDAEGKVVPVTVVQAGPCQIIKKITKESQDYEAVLVGFKPVDKKKLNKPQEGQVKKYGVEGYKHLKEYRPESLDGLEEKQELTVEIFEENEIVSVRGTSIGKGFAGTVKRHNFRIGPMSHGSKSHRIPGAIGAGTYPGRVFKGKKMAGHMGDATVTVKNLKVVGIDKEKNLLFIKGAIPGKKKNLIQVFN